MAILSATSPSYQKEKDLIISIRNLSIFISIRNLSIGASKGIRPTVEWRSHSGLACHRRPKTCEDEEDPSDNDRAEKGAYSEESFHCLETPMRRLEQEKCNGDQFPSSKHVRDLAANNEAQPRSKKMMGLSS
ncbi:hypothetical protein AVEN_6358-1 [Araneus ventricosus]|uniref:Uncharacterized protein n=1 Tax=Araneus ventricosus TaxID=182803 RepID=A0A4Y2HV80_ARAVE|nr:hypothetical protein AVEN_6358-1 [Araneus ventricosus]